MHANVVVVDKTPPSGQPLLLLLLLLLLHDWRLGGEALRGDRDPQQFIIGGRGRENYDAQRTGIFFLQNERQTRVQITVTQTRVPE